MFYLRHAPVTYVREGKLNVTVCVYLSHCADVSLRKDTLNILFYIGKRCIYKTCQVRGSLSKESVFRAASNLVQSIQNILLPLPY